MAINDQQFITWEDFCKKVMEDSNLNSRQFFNWLYSKKYLGGTFYDSGTWRKQYEVYRQINYTDDDFFEVIIGLEGWGKSKLARQKAAVVDPTFCKDRIFRTRHELYNWYRNNNGKTKGKAIIIDEGAVFFSSRETMSKSNIMFIKFLSSCRACNTYIIVCVPNFNAIDTYAREHRIEALTRLTQKHHAFKYYNKAGIKQIIKHIKGRHLPIETARVKQINFFLGYWNSQEPMINDINEITYNKVKNEAFNKLLEECLSIEGDKKYYFTISEVAKLLNVGYTTVQHKVADGHIMHHFFGGRYLIPRDEVAKLTPAVKA